MSVRKLGFAAAAALACGLVMTPGTHAAPSIVDPSADPGNPAHVRGLASLAAATVGNPGIDVQNKPHLGDVQGSMAQYLKDMPEPGTMALMTVGFASFVAGLASRRHYRAATGGGARRV